MKYRIRIKKLIFVKASTLRASRWNWRLHPESQRSALTAMFETIGIVGAILAREAGKTLEIIDGHLRADLTGDARVPVLITDLTAAEARTVIATYDPIGDMAEVAADTLAQLVADIPDLECPPLEDYLHMLTAPPVLEGSSTPPAQAPSGADPKGSPVTCPNCGTAFIV